MCDDLHLSGLSVDWVTGNLYFTEGDAGRIVVIDLENSIHTVYSNLKQPRGIAADPLYG